MFHFCVEKIMRIIFFLLFDLHSTAYITLRCESTAYSQRFIWIQSDPKNLTSFRRSIILAILVEITSNSNRMYRNRQRFYIYCFIFVLEEDSTCFSLWESAKEMDQAWWRWSQFSDKMAATDLSPCYFFLWGYVKGLVYVPLLPACIDKLRQRISFALNVVTEDMLQLVWQVLNYRLDRCCVTGGAHIEHLWNQSQNKLMMFNFIGLDWVIFKIIAFKMMSIFCTLCISTVIVLVY